MTLALEPELTPAEVCDLRRLAGIMVPADPKLRMPGADDEAIVTDIVRSLGQALGPVRKSLSLLREMSGGDFVSLAEQQAETTAMALLEQRGPAITALGRAVLQCYYRDDRVVLALGQEPRAPFPKGHVMAPSDWSLLDDVRRRPTMWRDLDGHGA